MRNYGYKLANLLVFTLFVAITGQSAADAIAPVPQLDLANVDRKKVLLGELLFHSPKLSRNNEVSCASCHDLATGGDDGRPVSVGVEGRVGDINAPTVLNSSLNRFQFWDGRADSLAAQVAGPIHNPVEMDSNWEDVIQKLSVDVQIAALFDSVYGDGITQDNIVAAIVAFEETLVTPNSPFDLYISGESDAIEVAALRGYEHFKSMGCVSCHQGVNMGGNLFQYFGIIANYFEDRGDIKVSDYGRYNVTGAERDKYKFKVPSLRNVAQTAPYFHDGSAATLREAIEVMAYYQLGRSLTEAQVSELEAFLISLTGELQRMGQ